MIRLVRDVTARGAKEGCDNLRDLLSLGLERLNKFARHLSCVPQATGAMGFRLCGTLSRLCRSFAGSSVRQGMCLSRNPWESEYVGFYVEGRSYSLSTRRGCCFWAPITDEVHRPEADRSGKRNVVIGFVPRQWRGLAGSPASRPSSSMELQPCCTAG